MSGARSEDARKKGNIEQRGDSLRVRLYAGLDPVTHRQIYLRATIPGTDDAAWKKAENELVKFRAQVLNQRSTSSNVRLGDAIDEWMRHNEIDDSTRAGYTNYIEHYIRPMLGKEPVKKIDARLLESFYSELRRCRNRQCKGKPFIEKHAKDEEHNCKTEECKAHACKPLSASTIRQIHSILSGTLSSAERWGWITTNPARVAKRPKPKPPEPDPPSPAEAAKLIEAAFNMDDDDWGTLVWLVMTTGIRRGELCGLRFSRVDLDAETIEISRNWVGGKEKDTKTHQSRRLALDSETVALLRDHKKRVKARVEALGQKFTEDLFVFTSLSTKAGRVPDHREPYSPTAVSARYADMATRAKIKTHLHALRHYSATELLTAGVDLRTVAGRLGHGGGGATTLRVYAAWVAAADRKAAEILGSRMPKRARADTID